MPVNTQRKDYDDMTVKWKRLRDCYEGRDAVIRAGSRYVPDLPGGDTAMNNSYRARGTFFNALKRTVQGMAGAMFQEAPEVEFPDVFRPFLDDLTLTNVPFEAFAAEAGRELVLVARYGVLIDMPTAPPASGGAPRPYCIGYKAEDIINWRTERQGGDEILTMIVLHEVVEAGTADDPFKTDCTDQYRVMELKDGACVIQLYREMTVAGGAKSYQPFGDAITPTRRGAALPFIPFVVLGATRTSPDIEPPSLTDLADVNLGHWRNSVDHEWGLHLVALPTPWVAGVKGASTGPMKIGPSVVWELETQGQAGMLEFSGAGLSALVTAMSNKEKLMAVLGARLLEQAAQVRETAAAVRMRHSDETANLKSIASSIEIGLTLILKFVEWWAGTTALPINTMANVELNKEYLNVKASPQEVQVALTALQAGEISFETWWNFLSTGGWGREGIDAVAERTAINAQKTLAPEPALDPALSSPDPLTPGIQNKPPVTKTVADAAGRVKYTITESQG